MNHTLLYIIAGYLSGSILSARICSSFMKKDILIYSNDNNPGAANAFTYGGFFCGIITLFGDILKGFLPVYCYLLNAGGMSFNLTLVLAAPVIGHILPVFYHFKGGKGIAVTFGCLLGLFPDIRPALILAAAFIFFSLIIRIIPHYYRTMAAYTAALIIMYFTDVFMPVLIGFFIIHTAVMIKLFLSTEQKERLQVRLLWMH
ncbi:MAG: glycerol-3-phosphate acyltransferase [Lachnospiraceae bacterium]|jgi:glycerol-3-phosphate acyltransferase PlsY